MFIEPNTNIRLLKGVPLDTTYKHTLYFGSVTQQTNYFIGLTKYNLEKYSYQRVQKGSARVGLKADLLYDCNYMMFQNTSFGTKWFYAFITGVEYINNEVSEITFEIDVMQTWYFDYTLRECFVEREHSSTDIIGDNIVAEPVALGEYVYSGYEPLTNMRDMVVFIAIIDTENSVVNGNIYDGVYGGATLFCFNSDDVGAINSKLSEYAQKPDSVVAMYTAPKLLVPNVEQGGTVIGYKSGGSSKIISLPTLNGTEDFNGYTPKNKKLYTYPYNYLHLDNASGSSLALRYEFFDELTPVIAVDGCITSPVKIVARPCSYKGSGEWSELGGYKALNNETISLESYPMCSWNTDSFKSWLAQNSVPILGNLLLSTGLSFSTANPLPIIGNLASVLTQSYSASIKADIGKGNINSGNVNVSNNRQQFYKSRVHITDMHAKIIDDYFTMYGYATNRVKIPNISSRPHWNYVQTINCTIVGSIPADDMHKICNIYDSGVTFWKNGANVGNYSLDNTPASTSSDSVMIE